MAVKYANAAAKRAAQKRRKFLLAHPKKLAAGRARAAAIRKKQAITAAARKRQAAATTAARQRSAAAAKKAASVTKAANAAQPATPYVEINSNGQLDLPYSTQYGWEVLNSTEEMNKSLLDLQQQQQAQALDYTNTKRDLGQQFETGQRSVLNQASARGLARSSMYGHQYGELATDFNNASTDLESANTLANQGFSLGRTQIQNAFNNMLRQVGLMRAQEAAQNAGKLGYGKATPKTTPRPRYTPPVQRVRPKPKPKKKKKAKGGKKTKARRLAAKKALARKRAAAKRRRK